ncbi:MAG: energy transducer TonB [Kangiella sp.]|jgi:protein TonB|nr:energy transducer TonB [Kangiella sp.]MCW9029623.1 energy transducer TonB [Kangiella sp.]
MSQVTQLPQTELVKLSQSPVKDGDRLKFTIFLAICLHLLLFLGVRFVLPESEPSQIPIALDVTLAQRESIDPPDKADFVGQTNQQGAGESETAERATTKLEHFKNIEGDTDTPSLELIPEQHQSKQALQLVTTDDSQKAVEQTIDTEVSQQNTPDQSNQPTEITPPPELLEQYNLEQDVANQLQTRGIKKRQISAAIYESPVDAQYLELWRKKIEQVGNLHYPEQAKRLGIYGNLTLKVSIDTDGSLLDVIILRTSGEKVLDQAALEIVRLSAPFEPLPESMRHNTDVLEIVRTWQFKPDNSLNTRN